MMHGGPMGPPGGPGGHPRPHGPGDPRDRGKKPKKKKLHEIRPEDMEYIKSLIWKYRKGIGVAILLTILNSLLTIVPPLMIQILIDNYIMEKDIQGIIVYALLILSLYMLGWIVSFKQSSILTQNGLTMVCDMRQDIYKKIIDLPLLYHSDHARGDLLSVVTNDVDRISNSITSGIVTLFSDFVSFIGIIIIMVNLSGRLTLITLIIIPIIIFAIMGIRGKVREESYKVQEKTAKLNTNVEESISGIREIQSFAMEKRNQSQFSNIAQKNVNANIRASVLIAIFTAVISANSFLGTALVIGIGGNMVISGAVSIGILVAFLQYINQLIRPLSSFSEIYSTLQVGAASLIHINTYLNINEQIKESEITVELPQRVLGNIDLKDVSFSYGRVPLFDDLNLSIRAGEKIGLVGETGSGKTTLIRIITRLYDIQTGEIQLDGINMKSLRNSDIRSITAIVSQKVILFSDNILNNIRFSKPDATDGEVLDAAIKANADKFIRNLPNGYHTQVGENGAKLSGGQKQLLSYARMILSDPKIVILDEATSNIDSYTEDKIQQNMKQILENRTTIVIAHRFATLKDVDRIIVLKEGKILDVGTHSQLFSRNAYYQELCKKQYYNN